MPAVMSRRALFMRPAAVAAGTDDAVSAVADTIDAPAELQIAQIAASCLNENGAYCRSCGEMCPEGAIRFHLMPRGRARVDVDAERCTGCGDCVSPCPVGAVTIGAGSLPAPATADFTAASLKEADFEGATHGS